MTFNVVSLIFNVTPTTITDQYNVTVTVNYSTDLSKPALRVLPYFLTLSMFQEDSYEGVLTITIPNPTVAVRNVTIDASNLDIAIADTELRIQIKFTDDF